MKPERYQIDPEDDCVDMSEIDKGGFLDTLTQEEKDYLVADLDWLFGNFSIQSWNRFRDEWEPKLDRWLDKVVEAKLESLHY